MAEIRNWIGSVIASRWSVRLVVLLVSLWIATRVVCHAAWLGAGILPDPASEIPLSKFQVNDFLRKEATPGPDGAPVYTLDFEDGLRGHDSNKEFVTALSHSISLTPEVKRLLDAEYRLYLALKEMQECN